MAKNNYKDNLGLLADQLKTELTPAPVQQVVPATPEPVKQPEAQFNIYLSKALLEEIRQHCHNERISKKELATRAIESYLKQHGA